MTKKSEMEEQSRQRLGKSKKIKDATLVAKESNRQDTLKAAWFDVQDPEEVVYEMGEKDAPPLEMTDELFKELVEEEKEKEEKQEGLRNNTQHYTNGVNEWRLIAKTYNNILDWEHVTTAMRAGDGCLVCVKEAIGQKMHSTMTFVPNVELKLWKDKWTLE